MLPPQQPGPDVLAPSGDFIITEGHRDPSRQPTLEQGVGGESDLSLVSDHSTTSMMSEVSSEVERVPSC